MIWIPSVFNHLSVSTSFGEEFKHISLISDRETFTARTSLFFERLNPVSVEEKSPKAATGCFLAPGEHFRDSCKRCEPVNRRKEWCWMLGSGLRYRSQTTSVNCVKLMWMQPVHRVRYEPQRLRVRQRNAYTSPGRNRQRRRQSDPKDHLVRTCSYPLSRSDNQTRNILVIFLFHDYDYDYHCVLCSPHSRAFVFLLHFYFRKFI